MVCIHLCQLNILCLHLIVNHEIQTQYKMLTNYLHELEMLQEYRMEAQNNVAKAQWNRYCGHDNINLRKHLGLMIILCCSQKKPKRRLGNLPGSGMDLIICNIVFLIIFYYRSLWGILSHIQS